MGSNLYLKYEIFVGRPHSVVGKGGRRNGEGEFCAKAQTPLPGIGVTAKKGILRLQISNTSLAPFKRKKYLMIISCSSGMDKSIGTMAGLQAQPKKLKREDMDYE
jgi:hypothetical protein